MRPALVPVHTVVIGEVLISPLNWVDVLAITLILRMGYVGFRRGLKSDLIALLIITLGLLLSYWFLSGLTSVLGLEPISPPAIWWIGGLAIIGVAVVVGIVMLISFLSTRTAHFLGSLIGVAFGNRPNQFVGITTGILRGGLTTSFILAISQQLIPLPSLAASIEQYSFSGPVLSRVAPALYDIAVVPLPSDWKTSEILIRGLIRGFGWVDALAVALAFRMSYIGFRLGVGAELTKLAGLIAGFLAGYRYQQALSTLIVEKTLFPMEWTLAAVLVALVLLGYFLITVMFHFFGKLIEAVVISQLSRLAGLLVGFFRGVAIASVVLVIFQQIPSAYLDASINQRSLSGPVLVQVAPSFYDAVMPPPKEFP